MGTDQKSQQSLRPGSSVKFLRVVWSGKTNVIPAAVLDNIQRYPLPESVQQPQTFSGLLGYWRPFIPHPAPLLLYRLVKKGAIWGWRQEFPDAFTSAKVAVKQTQELGVVHATKPCELDVSVYPEGFGGGSWQKQDGRKVPLGFWSQLGQGAEQRYSPTKKQLLAVCLSRQRVERITKDTIPACWMDQIGNLPKPNQPATLHKWCASLQQRGALSTRPHSAEVRAILGPSPVLVKCLRN